MANANAPRPDSSESAASNYDRQWLDSVRLDDKGLICAIAQDAASGRVLMQAWMNRESLEETVATGRVVYWSRSRQRLWRKGEESGNVQRVRELRLDCDGDSLLIFVDQEGGIACHTGRESCYYQRLTDGVWQTTDPVIQSPEQLYGKKPSDD